MSQNPGVNPIDPSQKMLEMFFQGDQAAKTRAHEQSLLKTRVGAQAAIAKDQSKMQLLAQQERLAAAKDQQLREIQAQKANYDQYQQFLLQRDQQAAHLKRKENQEIMKQTTEREMAKLKYVEGLNYSKQISNQQKLKALNQYAEDQTVHSTRVQELAAYLQTDKAKVEEARTQLVKSLNTMITESQAIEELFGRGLAEPALQNLVGDVSKDIWPLFTETGLGGAAARGITMAMTGESRRESRRIEARNLLVEMARQGVDPAKAMEAMAEAQEPVGGLIGLLRDVQDAIKIIDVPAMLVGADTREAPDPDDKATINDNALGVGYLMLGQMGRYSKMQFGGESYLSPEDTTTAGQALNLLLQWPDAAPEQKAQIKEQVNQIMQKGNPRAVSKLIDTIGMYGQAYGAASEFVAQNPDAKSIPIPTGADPETGEVETVELKDLLPYEAAGRELSEMAKGMAQVFGRLGETRLALSETGFSPPDPKALTKEAYRLARDLEASTTPEAAAVLKDRILEMAQALTLSEEQNLNLPLGRFVDSLGAWQKRQELQRFLQLEERAMQHAQFTREEEIEGGELVRHGDLLQEYIGDIGEMLE